MAWGQRGRAKDNARIEQLMVYGDYYAQAPDRAPGPGPTRALPDAPEALVGREREPGELLAVLAPGSGARAVVVAGLAGVGKSALAVTAAERALERGWFTGGVLFLSLRGYDPAGAVGTGQALETLLEGLCGVDAELPAGRDGRLARYRSELAARARDGRRVLVVADDAGDAAQVRDLVPPGGDAHRLLVTSRNRLVAQDFTARVLDLEVLGADAAGELVVGALRRVRPDDPRPGAEAAALAEVAGHCGRLPLALTVAAAVLAGDPGLRAAELARQLADARTRLEALSPRDRVGIPTGVRAAFGLSYARLPEEQQRMLRLLTAVPGPDCETGFAAFALHGPVAEADWGTAVAGTRALLAALVSAGLLTEKPSGSHRWHMHDLVRLYAVELADTHAEDDGREAVVNEVLWLYASMLRGAYGHLGAKPTGCEAQYFPNLATALRWLDDERANPVAAVSACAALSRAENTIELAGFLSAYLLRRRFFEDVITTCRIALDESRRSGDRAAEHVLLNNLGLALAETSSSEEAAELHESVVAFHEDGEDGIDKAVALMNLAYLKMRNGHLAEARATNERALALLRVLGALAHEGDALADLALILVEEGRMDEAVQTLDRAVALLSEHGEPLGAARAVNQLAGTLKEAGRPDEAVTRYREAVELFRGTGERQEKGAVAESLGLLLFELGRADEAIPPLWEAADAARAAGDHDREGLRLTLMGAVMLSLSEVTAAVEMFEDALRLRQYAADPGWPAEALYGLGTAHHRMGDFDRAMPAHFEATVVFWAAGRAESAKLAQEAFSDVWREAARRRGLRGWWRRLRIRIR
ncbi:tetratricopeptide repeat protein [Streptomyces sp. NPDC056387]|uniref:tetratricopeptide repeat protein n=1 Tax=Streptomyces sp. NPDC056387 TaxID=3345803 RepID=UPI0035E2FA62